jgi:N-acetylneuraminic acid mutarotase
MRTVSVYLLFTVVIVPFIYCKKDKFKTNQQPTANAGADQVIVMPKDSVLLDGTASSDADGRITAYKWSKVTGPGSPNISKDNSPTTIVHNLSMGVYTFELLVLDDGGLRSTDTVRVSVDNPAFEQPPVACAGDDTVITLPANTITLDGSCSSDPDNNLKAYQWAKISGPATFTISDVSAKQTEVTNLVKGEYRFELKVTDSAGLSSRDTVAIIVLPALDPACNNSDRPQIQARLIPIGTLSQARTGMAVASAGNKIVFAGASLSGAPASGVPVYGSSIVDIYDFATQTWSTGELSKVRSDIAAVAAGNKIFFAGGRLGDGANDQLFSTVDIYDVSTNTWSVSSLSQPRAYIAAAALGDKVFFAGGEKDWNYNTSDRVDIYDMVSGAWTTAQLSEARAYISAVAIDNKVYFAGGHTEDRWYRNPVKTIDIYDNVTHAWTTSSLSSPKAMSAGIAVANKIYWAGGSNGGDFDHLSCSVEVRDVQTQSTSIAYLYNPGRWVGAAGQNAVVKDNKIIFFRHYNHDASMFDIYDIATNTWSIGVLPVSITSASIISVNNNIYLAGGVVKGKPFTISNQVWRLEF